MVNMNNRSTALALKYKLQHNRIPFERQRVLHLPRGRSGVYALWLPSVEMADWHDCIYVGKSETCVRRRLLDHLGADANPKLRKLLYSFRELVEFSVAFTKTVEETDALETTVIRDWQPNANRNKI